MTDPVLATILQTGGLSLQELFGRVGGQLSNRLRVASLLKNGEARLERAPAEGAAQPKTPELQITPGSSENEIAERLQGYMSAEEIEIVPTFKAWRSSAM